MPLRTAVKLGAMILSSALALAQGQSQEKGSAAIQDRSSGANAAPSSVPRMPDGHPDMQGLWFTRPWEDPTKSQGSNFFQNLVPADGGPLKAAPNGGGFGGGGGRGNGAGPVANLRANRPHYFPAAEAVRQELAAHHLFEDPEGLCQLPGVPRAFYTPPYPYQFIQDEKSLVMLLEYVEDSRIIPITNTPHPKNYWAWNGDSRAHWEGDTLVVDVANFNGRAWLDPQGDFFDENLHIIERYTMTGKDTIAYDVTATDPTLFAEPWVNHRTFYRQPDSEQILEYSCKEGERSIQHYTTDLGGKAAVGEK